MQDMSLAKASVEMFGKIIYLVLFHFCLHLSELVDLQMRVESLKSDKKKKNLLSHLGNGILVLLLQAGKGRLLCKKEFGIQLHGSLMHVPS